MLSTALEYLIPGSDLTYDKNNKRDENQSSRIDQRFGHDNGHDALLCFMQNVKVWP